jgi:hypothetical protein
MSQITKIPSSAVKDYSNDLARSEKFVPPLRSRAPSELIERALIGLVWRVRVLVKTNWRGEMVSDHLQGPEMTN